MPSSSSCKIWSIEGTDCFIERELSFGKEIPSRKNVRKMSTASLGTLLFGSAGLIFLLSRSLASPPNDVKGTLSCSCGKLCLRICAPRSTPTAACHCQDCLDVVEWAKNKKSCTMKVICCSLSIFILLSIFEDEYMLGWCVYGTTL